MNESFRGVDRGLVHHLHAAGNDSGADDPRHAFAGRLDLGKADHQSARRLRLLQDSYRDFGDDTEQSFRPCDDSHQVIAGALRGLAADTQDLARHQHDLASEHVVGGHAVFEAMHAAGILRDIASDRAGNLGRRIGRIIKAGMRDRLADGEIGDARLSHDHAVVEIDLADTLEFAEPQQHRVRQRQRAARQRRAGATRHHLDALLEAIFQHLARPVRWCPAAPPPSAAGDKPSARRTRKAAFRPAYRSRPRPARWRATPRRWRCGGPTPPDPARAS